MLKKWKRYWNEQLDVFLTNNERRYGIQFLCVYAILTAISFVMSVVNLFTQRNQLLLATTVFAVLSLVNVLLQMFSKRTGQYIARVCFVVELFVMFCFFIFAGIPEGFSCIWICLLPTCGLLLFGLRYGSVFSGIMLLILIFSFWTPFGRDLLQYQYTDSFLLRFPMAFIAFFVLSALLEAIRMITQNRLIDARKKYQYLSTHDYLTDLYNRYGFHAIIDRYMDGKKKNGYAFLILDVDNFKKVNDAFGHNAGDLVLKKLAQVLKESVGRSGEVSRWGGEEFAVLLFSPENAVQKAEQLRKNIEAMSVAYLKKTVRVTVSIGMSVLYPGQAASQAEMLMQADNRLYMAKKRGRNCVVWES